MKEQLVSFETALLAKEKGFTITECFYGINSSMIYDVNKKAKPSYQNTQEDEVDAPTQSLLQKWLRDEYGIHIELRANMTKNDLTTSENYMIVIKDITDNRHTLYDSPQTISEKDSNTTNYEQALEQGLQEALKLI